MARLLTLIDALTRGLILALVASWLPSPRYVLLIVPLVSTLLAVWHPQNLVD